MEVDEIWKDTDWKYYQVSNKGRVRSLPRKSRIRLNRRDNKEHVESWNRKGFILTPINCYGTHYVHIHDEKGKIHYISIKRLVAKAFLLDYNDNVTTCRILAKDGDNSNLNSENLYIRR